MVNYSAFHWSEKARKYAETLGTIFNVKGRVNTVSDLPSSGNKIGDVYLVGLVTDTDLIEYAWLSFDNVTRWEKLGSTATSMAFSALTGSPYDNTALKNALDDKYDASNPNGYITGITSAMVTTALGYSPANPSSLSSVATSGSYEDLLNKPTIPTVNNSTITITQGGTTKGSFTLNQSTDETIEIDAGGNQKTFDLFDSKWADHLLNDQNWLRADTNSWQDGTVYSNAYNHLVADYSGGTSQTETVGSYTITYVLATDKHKITTDETTVANIYNESGVAWYYILDTTNQRFKLPRENPAREELLQVIRAKGNNTTLGFTDRNGTVYGAFWNGTAYAINSGSDFAGIPLSQNPSGQRTQPANLINIGITTDSTKSGIISDMTDSTSVYKGKQYLYFYVGQFTQTATEQTAGLNAEMFNGKADVDLSNAAPNASASAKETIVGWGMPDWGSAVSLSTTIGSTYTCPSDGFLFLSNYNGVTSLKTSKNSDIRYIQWGNNYFTSSTIYPVVSGEVLKVDNNTGSGKLFFLKAKGV